MTPHAMFDGTARPRPGRLAAALVVSAGVHALVALLLAFDVAGIGGGLGLGVGPGFGVGAGGGVGLGSVRGRQIYSLEDIPEPRPPRDPTADETLRALLAPARAEGVAVPQPPRPAAAAPVVHFMRPARPLGAGVDLGARFAAAGAGAGGLGLGGGGGGVGWSLGAGFGRYVGGLRKVGLDVALVVDATGSMQNVIDDLKHHLDDLADTLQRLVPTARIGAVAYRDRDDGDVATAPRRSEDFLVKWSDLTFNAKKVRTFLDGIVAEGGGDWPEAVKDGLDCAMHKLKWRADAKKVIVLVGGSPPHEKDVPAIRKLIADWRAAGGEVSAIDVSLRLHEEHERKLYKWLYGEEPKQISPLPAFYQELRDSFGEIAKEGGGEFVAIGQDSALVKHVLVLTFGPQWQKDVGRIARGL
ncbi:MAG TPA: vWA domain-containing protein [Candidatus Binatia bacterium]|nr:vWA domain-containing protein [Candidatus Binatia bacterium]